MVGIQIIQSLYKDCRILARGEVNVLKKENFHLHLKAEDEIKIFDVEMQFDKDTEINKLSMCMDGEKIEIMGDTESIFIKLSKTKLWYMMRL